VPSYSQADRSQTPSYVRYSAIKTMFLFFFFFFFLSYAARYSVAALLRFALRTNMPCCHLRSAAQTQCNANVLAHLFSPASLLSASAVHRSIAHPQTYSTTRKKKPQAILYHPLSSTPSLLFHTSPHPPKHASPTPSTLNQTSTSKNQNPPQKLDHNHHIT